MDGGEAGAAPALVLVQQAEELLAAKKTLGVAKALKQALEIEPGSARAYRAMGVLQTMRGQPGRAAQAYREYLRLAPDAADAPQLRQMIQAYEASGSE